MTSRTANTLIVLGLLLAAGVGQWLLGVGDADAQAVGVGGAGGTSERSVAAGGREPGREQPRGAGVLVGVLDYHGRETQVSCATCHSTREPDLANGLGGKLPATFHQGLVYAHGGQSCLSCHHADDYDSLRLADGRTLAFADSRQLCAQCHGPQTRDYLNGSHGGMRGYWDKTKGDRVRNTCTDCHDVHAPAIPAWMPVFAPRDGAALQQLEREARVAPDHHE